MAVFDVCIKHPDVAICHGVNEACEDVSGLFYREAFLKNGRNPYDSKLNPAVFYFHQVAMLIL